MRENRVSGGTRSEAALVYGMRLLSHAGGNPETDVGRNLTLNVPRLLYRLGVRPPTQPSCCTVRLIQQTGKSTTEATGLKLSILWCERD